MSGQASRQKLRLSARTLPAPCLDLGVRLIHGRVVADQAADAAPGVLAAQLESMRQNHQGRCGDCVEIDGLRCHPRPAGIVPERSFE